MPSNQSLPFLAAAGLLGLSACNTTPPHQPPGLRFSDGAGVVVDLRPQPAPAAGLTVATNADLAALPAPAEPTQILTTLATADEWRPLGSQQKPRAWNWREGQTLLQGYLGAVKYTTVERHGGSAPPTDGADDDLSQLPVIGGGGQWKLAGDRLDLGFEGLIGFGWRAGATAFVSGGGGAAVAVDVDLSVLDLYGGPFASVMLGDAVRAYGGAGPLMQWAWYEQGGAYAGSGSGFGLGYYARAGLEMMVGSGSLVGIGARWSDSTVDLSGDQGDLDLAGVQVMFTMAYFY